MNWLPTQLPYQQTGYFSKIITDYLDKAPALAPFYAHSVSLEGMQAALTARQQSTPVDRQTLVEALQQQYSVVDQVPRVEQNIQKLLQPNVFTVCTAHQPAIFTGPLYFIYKIIHTIKLADHLSSQWPDYQFVPVFYMGSEDADLEELGKIYLDGEKLQWDTRQKGAVGKMRTKGLEKILDRVEGELSVQPYGAALMQKVREFYLDSPDIQTATFRLLHYLFAAYGLVVLIPDGASLKRLMIPVFEDDLFQQEPARIVNETIRRFPDSYKVQANPRPINLFYMKDDLRGRIERVGDIYKIHESTLEFTEQELRKELQANPERFSPNVILRGLYQETILPNIAFIGGGGETAYWLELKALFQHYGRPFPMLILRNSFLLVEGKWKARMDSAGWTAADIFRSGEELLSELVRKGSSRQLSLEKEIENANLYYEKLKSLAHPVDSTLVQHVAALQTKAVHPLVELEKKLLRAEKRKYTDQQRQIGQLKAALFPHDGLQERIDNFMPWYALRGPEFISRLYQHSQTLEQQFVVLEEQVSEEQ